MIEKMKMLENMNLADLKELKTAILAYDLSLNSNEITFKEIDAIEETMEYYWDEDGIAHFISEDLVSKYDELLED
jgi:hypothetical protein